MKVTIKTTGEVIELPDSTLSEMMKSYQILSDYEKTMKAAKQKLAAESHKYIGDKGTSEVVDGYMFRFMPIQKKNYDKSVLRELLDEDTYDLFVVPDKKRIDEYLKENLESLGDVSTKLRQSMQPAGKPYSVTKLERVK